MEKLEENLQLAICEYIRIQYPNVIFRSDLGGVKLTVGQAVKNKRMHSKGKYPDFFMAEPMGGYHGLFLEFKKNWNEVYTKNGKIRKNKHIQGQADMLERLNQRGYLARFACEFEDTKQQIDFYLTINKKNKQQKEII